MLEYLAMENTTDAHTPPPPPISDDAVPEHSANVERWSWVDTMACCPVQRMTVEEGVDHSGNRTAVVWLPFDDDLFPELYRTVITQLRWIRGVIGSDTLTLKRSRAGANALHVFSPAHADVTHVLDLITEFVNFRVKKEEYQTKRRYASPYVRAFTVRNYKGTDLLGVNNSNVSNRNFIVELSELFGVRILITAVDKSTHRVAVLGNQKNTSIVRTLFKDMVGAVANGASEHAEQSRALELGRKKKAQTRQTMEQPQAQSSPPAAAPAAAPVETVSDVEDEELPAPPPPPAPSSDAAAQATSHPQRPLQPTPAVHFAPPPYYYMPQPYAPVMFDPATFCAVFTQSFVVAFNDAQRNAVYYPGHPPVTGHPPPGL